ncbi:hypothetical protein PHJA_002397800 [Phtheirospermum japonicum]|uniref:Uncharacterized protein n=1 Tax=Phtheirospermum japonicum TaxID=374723 RepID=A0A830CPR7_9LAMI|nr:hypothetical protein PHJA_002397800 [Phtheirospermum japonicum]
MSLVISPQIPRYCCCVVSRETMIWDTTISHSIRNFIGHFAKIFLEQHCSFAIFIGDRNKGCLMYFFPICL